MNSNVCCQHRLSFWESLNPLKDNRNCQGIRALDISRFNAEAVVQPVQDVHNRVICTYPLIAGHKIKHESWSEDDQGYYLIDQVNGDELVTINEFGNVHKFQYSSFEPLETWYYVDVPVEKKKSGFGLWYKDKCLEK